MILLAKTCCSLPGCDLDVTDKRDFLKLLVPLFVCERGSSLHLFFLLGHTSERGRSCVAVSVKTI